MKTLRLITLMMLLAGPSSRWVVAQQTDVPGSSDFPDLPRVSDTYIVGYAYSDYDVGTFVSEKEGYNPTLVHPEGKRTRIIYLGRQDQSTLQILKNYEVALTDFGEFREIYSCRARQCGDNFAGGIIWHESNRVPVSFRNPYSLYLLTNQYRDAAYLYGTIAKDESLYHASIFTTYLLSGQSGIRDQPIIHLEILETDEFESTLTFLAADEMVNEIQKTGSVALYGIQFSLDSAELTAESALTIAEIAKALVATPDLSVHVVGHTDSQGAYDYNQKLSNARASAVVKALANDHSIASERLHAVGVGPVAPVATNSTEEGRQLNRRVEIVAQ